MRALSDLLAAKNIPLTIVVYPWAQQIAQGDRNSRQVSLWREFCEGRCKAFIDLYPVFFAASEADKNWYERLYIVGDDHFSAAGNRLVFEEVAKRLFCKTVMLQISRDAFISSALSLEPGRICMISMYSQIVRPRSMLSPGDRAS